MIIASRGFLKSFKNRISRLPSALATEVQELEKRYENLGFISSRGVWTKNHLRNFDFQKFRGDNIYVWQSRMFEEINFFVSYQYALKMDAMDLNKKFIESKSYGVEVYEFDGLAISREWIDSILEINYLEEKIGLTTTLDLEIIDIGAGYGRLAFRLAEAFPLSKINCVDAIPLSTCLSRVYLEPFIESQQVIVHDLETVQAVVRGRINLAVNVHSFSEMSLEWVNYWIDFLVEKDVKYLFIVPNGSSLTLNNGADFGSLLIGAGYTVIDQKSKYSESDFKKFGIYPSTYFLLKKIDTIR